MHVAYSVAWTYLNLITGAGCPTVDSQVRIYLCPKLNFAASPFQQETSDDGEYFSTDVFDFELQFRILQTRPRIDSV